MKIRLLLVLLSACTFAAKAQIAERQLRPFLNGLTLIDASGPGLKQSSGDILLELASKEQDENETLILLHNEKGRLSRIAENSKLLMGKEMLGVSGGNYPSLSGNILSVNYAIGSNSALSDVSVEFEKDIDGQYYFKEYTSRSRNFGVENLFARQIITSVQTGKIPFAAADEERIFPKSKLKPLPDEGPLYKALERYERYIPEDWQLAAFAEGDLNLDNDKKDVLLVLYNDENCAVRILLQQKDGSYKTTASNFSLLTIYEQQYNSNNLKAVIKNGFFTIEQRAAVTDSDFDHRYITFKYDASRRNWLLHRIDIEHYSGFHNKPSAAVTHLTKSEFGTLPFQEMENPPGIYPYEPHLSIISGTITQKQFYGRPNYGETPETDEKVRVYILKTDHPVNVFANPDQPDPETADRTVTGISEIQIYSTDKDIDFKNSKGKKVRLQGVFQSAQTGHHYTPVLLEVTKIL